LRLPELAWSREWSIHPKVSKKCLSLWPPRPCALATGVRTACVMVTALRPRVSRSVYSIRRSPTCRLVSGPQQARVSARWARYRRARHVCATPTRRVRRA